MLCRAGVGCSSKAAAPWSRKVGRHRRPEMMTVERSVAWLTGDGDPTGWPAPTKATRPRRWTSRVARGSSASAEDFGC